MGDVVLPNRGVGFNIFRRLVNHWFSVSEMNQWKSREHILEVCFQKPFFFINFFENDLFLFTLWSCFQHLCYHILSKTNSFLEILRIEKIWFWKCKKWFLVIINVQYIKFIENVCFFRKVYINEHYIHELQRKRLYGCNHVVLLIFGNLKQVWTPTWFIQKFMNLKPWQLTTSVPLVWQLLSLLCCWKRTCWVFLFPFLPMLWFESI